MAELDVEDGNNSKSLFLHELESWIRGVLANNGEKQEQEIISLVAKSFRGSIEANIEYHNFMQSIYDREGERAYASYHRNMSAVYRSFHFAAVP